MLALETVARIRIDHFRGKVPNKAIARKRGSSEHSAKGGPEEFGSAGKRQPKRNLGPWIGELERMLVERAVLPAALERLSRPGSCSATQIRKIGKAAPPALPLRAAHSSPRRGLAGASEPRFG